jgi:enediyne biosynthesis protein E4
MSGSPAPHRGRRLRRLRRAFLWAAIAVAVLATAVALALRPHPEPYSPGADPGANAEITRGLARDLPPDLPPIRLTDAATYAGVAFRHFPGRRSTQLPEDMGSGAAWGDYDDDGDPDLFLVNLAGPLPRGPGGRGDAEAASAKSALFRNDGNGRFTDVTAASGAGVGGIGMGAAWGDYDGDGRLDLAVTRYGTNVLLRNRGDGAFEDVSDASGIAGSAGFWTGASWADFDRDGDADLYICGYVRYRFDAADATHESRQYKAIVPYTLNPSTYPPERNLLLRNDGGRFSEIAKGAGVDNLTGRSLSAAWADFDADGWPDLYVANDVSDNAMFRNLGNGRFHDVSHSAWVADYRGAMGLAVGDWENDGDLDLFITHWIAQENALYVNQLGVIASSPAEPLHFVDLADMNGLGQIALDFIGWGTGFIDLDNDGRLDLFAANGSTFQREDDPSRLIAMRNQLFWNGGPDRGFFEIGAAAGEALAVENVARGAAFADYDGDGDEDIALVVHGGDFRLLRNDSERQGGALRLVLRGPRTRPASAPLRTSTFALGARVTLTAGGTRQLREVGTGPSYLSQRPPGEVHFGLGSAAAIERIEITWPDGSLQTLAGLPPNSIVTIVQGEEAAVRSIAGVRPLALGP